MWKERELSEASAEELRTQAMEHVHHGRMEEAAEALAKLAQLEPESPDGWINLASVERDLGRLRAAAENFRRGVHLLESSPSVDRDALARTYTALGATLQSLELTDEAVAAFRRAAAADPRAPQPHAAIASLLARAGDLQEADRAATAYCRAAVSLLSEKENIGAVRRFQAAMKAADTVEGLKLLAATREAYVRTFNEVATKLPEGVRIEEEPFRRDGSGQPVPILANPRRPFSRVRFDAILPTTGQRWMINETPTYGYPKNCAAAAEGFFSVPLEIGNSFRTVVATRTAWDYFFVRIRFVHGLRSGTLEQTEKLLGEFYEQGFTGTYAQEGKGHFHFISEPFAIGDEGLRYELDLGLSRWEAALGLMETLERLHALEPIEVVSLGDGALPMRAAVG